MTLLFKLIWPLTVSLKTRLCASRVWQLLLFVVARHQIFKHFLAPNETVEDLYLPVHQKWPRCFKSQKVTALRMYSGWAVDDKLIIDSSGKGVVNVLIFFLPVNEKGKWETAHKLSEGRVFRNLTKLDLSHFQLCQMGNAELLYQFLLNDDFKLGRTAFRCFADKRNLPYPWTMLHHKTGENPNAIEKSQRDTLNQELCFSCSPASRFVPNLQHNSKTSGYWHMHHWGN